MRTQKWKITILLLVVISILFITGCTFDTTPTNRRQDDPITVDDNIADDDTTNDDTTDDDTTDDDTTDDDTTNDDQKYEKLDELILSLQRLENTEFQVNTKFVEESTNDINTQASSSTVSREFRQPMKADSDIVDPEDYIVDENSNYIYYHSSLLELPEKIGNFYRITSALDGRTIFNLHEFETGLSVVANMSKMTVDWAVDNLKIMDVWVKREDDSLYTNNMYLLEYDYTTDTVSLYNYYRRTDDLKVDSYTKISVYYNDKGEEVIETWQTYDYYEGPDSRGIAQNYSYYNSIAARDYNIADFSVDSTGQYMDNYMLRGVNLDSDNRYKFYENYNYFDRNYIKGEHGWFMYSPEINDETGEITQKLNLSHSILSPDLGNEAIDIYHNDDGFNVYVRLSAFEGDIAVLYDEDCQYASKIYETKDYYKYMTSVSNSGGVETVNGTYLTTDSPWNNVVSISRVFSSADKESRVLYDQYFNYYHVMELKIEAENLKDVVQYLEDYFNYIGLTYRFSTNSELLTEYKDLATKINDYIDTFPITNEVLGYDENPYTNTETYYETLDYIVNKLNIYDSTKLMVSTKEVIDISEQQDIIEMSTAVLLDIDSILTGAISFDIDSQTMDLSLLNSKLNKSPLLQENQSYSIYLAYMIGGKLYPFYQSSQKTFEGEDIQFDLTTLITIIPLDEIPEGEYTVVMYIGKIKEETWIRVSTLLPVEVTEFTEKTTTFSLETGYDDSYTFTYYETAIHVLKIKTDVQDPSFDLILDQVIEIGGMDVDWTSLIVNESDNSNDILTKLEVEDNVDYNTLGTYTVTISLTDGSSNETQQTFNVTVEASSG